MLLEDENTSCDIDTRWNTWNVKKRKILGCRALLGRAELVSPGPEDGQPTVNLIGKTLVSAPALGPGSRSTGTTAWERHKPQQAREVTL